MTTSIPTKSPDHCSASGASSAASYFNSDAGASGTTKDFADLLADNSSEAAPAKKEPAATAASNVLAGATVAPTLTAPEVETAQTPSREAIEQAAALLASLWSVLQPQAPVQPVPPAEAGTSASGASVPSTGSADVKVTLQWGQQPPVVLTLPGGAQSPADLAQKVGEQISELLDQAAGKQASAEAPGAGKTDGVTRPDGSPVLPPDLTISLEVAASATATVQPGMAGAKVGPKVSLTGAEKFAGKFSVSARPDDPARGFGEKNFLVAPDKEVTDSDETGGIGVAKPEGTMPAFFATRQITPERFEAVAHSWMSDGASTNPMTESTAASTESTAAASLARKAVDTIQSVIETQHIRTDHMGVVSLNFKFGAEDLAVRVQLRDGEVHTQFRTDSPELRAALSDEWHALATGQSGESGSRLIEPVFAPSNSSLSQQHSGSGSSGQSFAQKQQQEAQAPFALPEVRTFRRGLGAATAAAAEVAPQIARNLPTSLHLTAFA